MEADVLVYASNAHELPEMVRAYAALGVSRFHVWLLSAVDSAAPEVRGEVPRIADVVPHLTAAMDLGVALGLSDRPDFITSLHTPPCTVPESHHRCLFDAKALGLVVANPGRHRFPLEQSPIEGGHYKDACGGCRFRARCGGMRRDYVAVHGDGEFQPPA
jgi:cyclic pyranopterin phosphate synthase